MYICLEKFKNNKKNSSPRTKEEWIPYLSSFCCCFNICLVIRFTFLNKILIDQNKSSNFKEVCNSLVKVYVWKSLIYINH